jgi:hypothetical protein
MGFIIKTKQRTLHPSRFARHLPPGGRLLSPLRNTMFWQRLRREALIEQVLSENIRSRPEAVYKYSERKRAEIVNKKTIKTEGNEVFNLNTLSFHCKEEGV